MSDSIMVLSKSSSQKFSLDLLKLGSLVWLFAIAAIAKDISPFNVYRDFSSFRSLSCGSNNPERDIKKIEINKLGNIIEIKITANAFLQNMVRIIVGTLLEIGKDQIKTSLREILESKDRNSAGITINPRGLIFLGPNYGNITKLNPAKSPLIRIWK